MNTRAILLSASLLATGLSAQRPVRQPEPSTPRSPVDVSLEGLEPPPRDVADERASGGATGSSLPAVAGAVFPQDCLLTIADQATNTCLVASSVPSLGFLYPYPGFENVFVPPAFVGGGNENTASGNRATVGGGGYNIASGRSSTIAGGTSCQAMGDYATVGGGATNLANAVVATVGGGILNLALASGATIGGGAYNKATGTYATVAGGGGLTGNTASGRYAAVPGGTGNVAAGDYSFAAGRRAQANHDGSFVWGDSVLLPWSPDRQTSSAPDQFNVYCSGGARFFSDAAATAGVLLAPGAGSWSSVSDRASKENVEPVDGRAVLERLAALPLATWNYKTQDDAVRHMGPMAQDFRAAFGLGASDERIDTIDPDGVALAAIQGLNALAAERDAQLAALLAEKDAEIEELRARLERLERALAR